MSVQIIFEESPDRPDSGAYGFTTDTFHVANSCRACLSTKYSLIEITVLDHDLIKFSDKLTACVPEVMWLKEGVPSLICSNCIESLRVSYEFRNVCLQSDQTLTRYILQMRDENRSGKAQDRSTSSLEIDDKFECTAMQVLPDTLPCIKEEFPNSPQIHFLDDDDCLEESEHFIEISKSRNYIPEPEKCVNFIGQKQLELVIGINHSPHNNEEPDATEVTQVMQLDQQQHFLPQNELQVQHELELQRQPSQQSRVIRQTTDVQVRPCSLEYITLDAVQSKCYTCRVCGKTYRRKAVLKVHMQTHTGEKPFELQVQEQPSQQKQMVERTTSVQEWPHSLNNVILDGIQPKRHTCTMCGKTYQWNSHLRNHIRTHTREKLFECKYCKKRFHDSSYFLRHQKRHLGEEQFQCAVCNKKFMYKSDIQRHIRSHTDETPFACTICGKRYKWTHCLKIHMRLHTDERPYSCDTCGKKFISPDELSSHTRTHTGIKLLTCRICEKTFSYSVGLRRHMKKHSVGEI